MPIETTGASNDLIEIDGDDTAGVLDYDKTNNLWVLICDGSRGCGQLDTGDGSSAAEHDRLVRAWYRHDRDQHGGDGLVHPYMLLEQDVPA